MDGVPQEHNLVDNLSDAWSEYSYVEELADNFMNGVPDAQHVFVRALALQLLCGLLLMLNCFVGWVACSRGFILAPYYHLSLPGQLASHSIPSLLFSFRLIVCAWL